MMYFIRSDRLRAFMLAAFQKAGLLDEDASLCADNLLYADLRGIEGEGIVRLKQELDRLQHGGIKAHALPAFEPVSSAAGIVDGHHAIGPVTAHCAITEAIGLAKATGVGVVTVIHGGPCGAPGFYGEIAAREGMVAVVVANTEPVVVPHGGRNPFFGSSPLVITFPDGAEGAVTLETLTSVVPFEKIENAKREHQTIPKDWAIDSEAAPTGDPLSVAALLPFGGGKGHSLGLAINVLTSLLTGAVAGPDVLRLRGNADKPAAQSQFFLVIDIGHFAPRVEFLIRVRQMLERLRTEPTAPDFPKVFVPGETEMWAFKKRSAGGIPIPEKIWSDLEDIANHYKIEKPGRGAAAG